jgi:hypothetical protein
MIAIPKLSHRQALAAGLALLVGVNAIALGGVAWNRGAEDARLHLTERELRLPYTWRNEDGEDPGLSMQLEWRNEALCATKLCKDYEYGDTIWLDADKLATLGFDTTPRPRPQGTERAQRSQEREVLLALEFEGPAFVRYLQRRDAELREAQKKTQRTEILSAAEQLRQAAREDSRLFAVDAGLDRAALRAKYPDRSRYALVPALVGFTPAWEGEKFIAQGRVHRLLGEGINVPLPLARKLGANAYRSLDNSAESTHFSADVAFGRRLEPWLLEVSPAASR